MSLKLQHLKLQIFLGIFLIVWGVLGQSLASQNVANGLFQDQRSLDLNIMLEPWGDTASWGKLQDIHMSPDGQLHFFFVKGYLSLSSDLSVSQDTLLSIFYSQAGRWKNEASQHSFVSPELLLVLLPNGVVSLYNSHLGTWLDNVKELKNGKSLRLYGRQLITFQDDKALLYPDILSEEAPQLIADQVKNTQYPQLLPSKQILYYDNISSALILTQASNGTTKIAPLLVIPPKEFYRKMPQTIGAMATSKTQSPKVFYAIFRNILTFFNQSGKKIFTIPLPSQAVKAFPIGNMLFLHSPELGKVEIYSPRPLLQNYLPPQEELLLQQAIETGERLEDQVLLEQAQEFYQWAMQTVDQVLLNKSSDALYQLRVKLNDALNRVSDLLQTHSDFYFTIQKDLQGYQSLIQSAPAFKNYRYRITLSLAWEGLQMTQQDLSYQDLIEFPWHVFFQLSGNKSLPKDELRILLQPSVDTSKSFVDGISTETLQAHYFSFSFTP